MRRKIMFAWMGVGPAGQQMFGNTTMTITGAYRTEKAMAMVAAEIQRLNCLRKPAAVMGCIELDEEES